MTRTEQSRERLRVERELREAERVLAHLRNVTLDEAAQALKDHAELMGIPVVEVARELLAHRPVIRPRVLRRVTDMERCAETDRAGPVRLRARAAYHVGSNPADLHRPPSGSRQRRTGP